MDETTPVEVNEAAQASNALPTTELVDYGEHHTVAPNDVNRDNSEVPADNSSPGHQTEVLDDDQTLIHHDLADTVHEGTSTSDEGEYKSPTVSEPAKGNGHVIVVPDDDDQSVEMEDDYEPSVADNSQPLIAATDTQDDMSVDMSDGYEPPEAEIATSHQDVSEASAFSPAPAAESASLETSDSEGQAVSATYPITQPISTGEQESAAASPREVDIRPTTSCCSVS